MMREIKFRAWDKSHLRMCYVVSLNCYRNKDHVIKPIKESYEPYVMKSEELEIMQYTGLKDKSGIEIYEGDIVEFLDEKPIIEYHDEHCSYGAWAKSVWGYKFVSMQVLASYEIIGNIHQNPELIKK